MPDKKLEIIASSIEQDQQTVASQWTNTFLHNAPYDTSTQIMQLLCACVAAGDFKTRSAFSSSKELQAPSDQLTIADYLSHASRIILDYQDLSEVHKAELLSYFPEPNTGNSVFSRSATHNVSRSNQGAIIEGKGLMIGLKGQLPSMLKTPHDFGVNIAMGGEGQQNFHEKKISANGFSGHVYFHKNTDAHLLMVGLEQSAPASSILELWTGNKSYPEEEQQHQDQFGQKHSVTGASDVYTAAASLYFSDPIHQAKMVLEKGCFPPDKYGAMQATLTDENWPAVKGYLDRLKQAVTEQSADALLTQLLDKPATASSEKQEYVSYIALDFKTYLQRVYAAFIQTSSLEQTQQLTLQTMQNELFGLIKKLQDGDVACYEKFINQIAQITAMASIPAHYKEAIERINSLFQLQLNIDKELNNTHQGLILKAQYEALLEEANELKQQIENVKQYFKSDHIHKDEGIFSFILALEQQLLLLTQIEDKSLLVDLYDLEENDSENEFVSEITDKQVKELEQQITQCHDLLCNAPKLYSTAILDEQCHKLKQSEQNKTQITREFTAYKLKVEEEQEQLKSQIKDAQANYELLLKQGKLALARTERIAPIFKDIDQMVAQQKLLIEDGLKTEALQAEQLIAALNKLITEYRDNLTENEELALSEFKGKCINELLKPRKELDEHQKFNHLIANALLAVLLIGVGYIVAAGANRLITGRYTFFHNMQLSENIKERVGELKIELGIS